MCKLKPFRVIFSFFKNMHFLGLLSLFKQKLPFCHCRINSILLFSFFHLCLLHIHSTQYFFFRLLISFYFHNCFFCATFPHIKYFFLFNGNKCEYEYVFISTLLCKKMKWLYKVDVLQSALYMQKKKKHLWKYLS